MADNDKKITTRFQTVANYELDTEVELEMPLVDYRMVIDELAAGRRTQFFMHNIGEYISEPGQYGALLGLLEGKHSSDVRISIIKAKDGGNTIFMPVCEDMKSGDLLVVGPRGVGGADAWRELTYVNAELYNRDKAVTQVNDFIAAALKFRMDNGELDRDAGRALYEDIIRAFLLIAEPRGMYDDSANSPPATFGHCMAMVADGEGEVSGYVVARPFFDSDKVVQDVMSGVAGDITVRKPFTFKPKR